MSNSFKKGSYKIQQPSVNSPPKVRKYPIAPLSSVVSNIERSRFVRSRIVPKRKISPLNNLREDFVRNSARFNVLNSGFTPLDI